MQCLLPFCRLPLPLNQNNVTMLYYTENAFAGDKRFVLWSCHSLRFSMESSPQDAQTPQSANQLPNISTSCPIGPS